MRHDEPVLKETGKPLSVHKVAVISVVSLLGSGVGMILLPGLEGDSIVVQS
jgi:hypothetical protein